ncbi:MAG: hypothetical protein KA052_00895 [Candidatus Pacebacteria bacterium]|nr:hypothetical protein [Candidatus Paceibacterota bacterium]
MNQQKNENLIQIVAAIFLFFFLFTSPSYFFASAISQTWSLRDTPENGYWTSVAWAPSLHLFAAVGHNTVMTSPDGVVWTVGTIPSGEWNALTWSPERNLFVAVGFGHAESGNDAVTSPDGITWTSQTTPTFTPIESPTPGDQNSYGIWNSVTWSPERNLFVAVGQNFTNSLNEQIMTSPDGITWSFQNNLLSTIWNSVTWSGALGRFVAVGYENTTISSSDGITWEISPPIGHIGGEGGGSVARAWRSVAWSPELGLFVAVSEEVNEQIVITSTDGISWTPRTGVAGHYDWKSIAWSPELGIFTAVSVNNAFMTSPDGIAWTEVTPPSNKPWSSIVWSPELGMFIGVANSGSTSSIATSDPVSPVISDVSSGTPDSTIATITWTTDIPTSSQVYYGSTSDYGTSTELDSLLTRMHSVSLTGLATCAEYHYQTSSTYAGENALSPDNTFTTAGCVSAPVVSTIDATSLTDQGATLQGSIDTLSSAPITERGFHLSLNDIFNDPIIVSETSEEFPVGTFTLDTDALTCSTSYYYRAYASTENDTTGYGSGLTFSTDACSVTGPSSSGGGGVPIPPSLLTPPTPEILDTSQIDKKIPPVLFTRTLRKGTKSEDVILLQKFLNTHGYVIAEHGPGSLGSETDFFGNLTVVAISKFQTDYANEILTPFLLKKPTGFFGLYTLKKTNEILLKEFQEGD